MNQKGSSVIQAIVIAGIITSSFFAMLTSLKWHQRENERSNVHLSAHLIRHNIITLLRHPIAWNQIRSDVRNKLTCMGKSEKCSNVKSPILALYDGTAQPLLDFMGGPNGFGISGQPCTGFDEVEGNPECPFSLKIEWKPLCKEQECPTVPIEITGQLVYVPGSSKSRTPINLSKYSFKTIINP